MLPPFVPPSVRVASENLPLITDFVIDRVEHSFESSFSIGDTAEGGVATLPSIEEFVLQDPGQGRHEPAAETTEDEQLIQRVSRSPSGAYEAKHEVPGGAGGATTSAPAHGTLEPDLLLDRRRPLPGSQDAVVNEVVEPVDAWEASAARAVADRPGSAEDATVLSGSSETLVSPAEAVGTPPAAPEVWVAEERDAFDWHAVAHLAAPPAEAQRAAEEWSSTEWDRTGSVQDHVAAMLAQVSRRVRSGELEVQGSKQMGSEAALVAALSALLAEATKK
ncbi:MAG: hypothetical protein ABI026_10500 [Gemmatimonadaceae bacterium]